MLRSTTPSFGTALLALLAALVLAGVAVAAPASAASCPAASEPSDGSETFDVIIEEEPEDAADEPAGPDDDVIEITFGARGRTAYASCAGAAAKADPNPGFGVFPGSRTMSRRIFDTEARAQAGRDADGLGSARKKRTAKKKHAAQRGGRTR